MDIAGVWTTLMGAGAALAGALGSQFLAARAALRTRRLELYFRSKADAYQALMKHLGEFTLEPTDHAKYSSFLAAYEGALLFASDDVAMALVSVSANIDGFELPSDHIP